MSFVYVLLSLKDNKQYIGSTINLERRIKQHNQGLVLATKNRRPLEIKGYQIFETIEEAAIYEKKYKRSHGALERAIRNGKFVLNKRD